MPCADNQPGPFTCPTLEQSIAATVALLPRGRAWPANDRAMLPNFLAWLAGLVGIPAPGEWPAGFVQTGYFAAIGAVRNYLESQLCALRLEFWCATETLTNDEWLAEYGLPDDCEPFPDLCVKIAAIGGRRCEIYQAIAAEHGWTVECMAEPPCVGSNAFAGAGCAGAIFVGGAAVSAEISIVVDTEASPAWGGQQQTPFNAGVIYAGMAISCPPSIEPLQCVMERIVPAHVIVNYTTI